MELSATQIQQLYVFTDKKFVKYYDVQTELVDHLANDIETMMTDNLSLSFEDALQNAYKKFGIYGFTDVVTEKEKQLQKKYFRILLRHIKEWFSLPKITATVGLIYILYLLILQPFGIFVLYGTHFTLVILCFFKMYVFKKQLKKTKPWLLKEIIFKAGLINMFNLTMIPINTINANLNAMLTTDPNKWFILATAIYLCFEILFFYIAFIQLPKKSKDILSEHYPEYKTAS